MRPTINDLAKITGLSKTTISLVLNGKGERLSPQTREQVLAAAQEIGYRPSRLARGLTHHSLKTLGLVIPDIRNGFFPELAKGVEDAAYALGYNVFLCNSDNRREKEQQIIHALFDLGVDGIILDMAADPNDHGEEVFALLRAQACPVVLVDRDTGQADFSRVLLDNEQGAYLATRHLTQLGHRRIGCVAGALWLDCDKDRLRGYRRALQEAGLAYDESLLLEAGYQFEEGGRAALALSQRDISALFTFNDLMAYGAIEALQAQGLSVPGDVSVVGFDDLFFSRVCHLTTVRQPAYEMGTAAFKLLRTAIDDGQGAHSPCLIKPTLTVRGTTKPHKPHAG